MRVDSYFHKSLNPYFNGTCSKSVLSPSRDDAKSACLNPYFNGTCSKSYSAMFTTDDYFLVLILILMEHAQRGFKKRNKTNEKTCLNPYFNGTCSKRHLQTILMSYHESSLNPYFNGTCSKRRKSFIILLAFALVLILILMEHAQRDTL